MRLLLDTHIFLWSVRDDRSLTKSARSIMLDANEIYVSSATIWEASIKAKLNKLSVNIRELEKAIVESGFIELPITSKHAAATFDLPDLHRDPFDRMLIAQAMSEPLKLLTADKMLLQYSDLVVIV